MTAKKDTVRLIGEYELKAIALYIKLRCPIELSAAEWKATAAMTLLAAYPDGRQTEYRVEHDRPGRKFILTDTKAAEKGLQASIVIDQPEG